MDWKHALVLFVLLTVSGGLGVGLFFAFRQSPEQRTKQIDVALDQAELDVDAEARAA